MEGLGGSKFIQYLSVLCQRRFSGLVFILTDLCNCRRVVVGAVFGNDRNGHYGASGVGRHIVRYVLTVEIRSPLASVLCMESGNEMRTRQSVVK